MLFLGLGLFTSLQAQVNEKSTSVNTEVKNKIIKVKPFSPLLNSLAFGYEQRIKSNITGEATFGLIGMGFQPLDLAKKSGFYLTAGPRLYFGQDWKVEGMENLPMRGFYFKPELIFSTYKSSLDNLVVEDLTRDYRATSGALLLNLGRQFIAADIISFEFSAGLGYGVSSYNYTNQDEVWEEIQLNTPRFYSHIQGPNEFPIATKADISIGILLK